jgi:hypothetical protein
MNSWLFLCFVLGYVDTTSIGLIRNVSLTLITPTFSSTMNGTSQECLCAMMISSNISAFNYLSNNTCQLFSNMSLTNVSFSWMTNVNSLFYFLQLPTEAGTTTTTQDTTTSAVSMATSVSSTGRGLTTIKLLTTDVTTSGTSARTSASSTMAKACTTGKKKDVVLSVNFGRK